MKVLVLGATGQIGWNITRTLIDQHHETTLLCRAKNQSRVSALPAKLVIKDEPTKELTELAQTVDWVIDAAAPYPLDLFVNPSVFSQAEERTREIIKACRKGKTGLAYISSFVTLAHSKSNVFARLKRRTSPYFVLKARLENLILSATDLKQIIVNPSTVLGPGDFKSSDESLIGALMQQKIPFSYDTKINVIDARDLAEALITMMKRNTSQRPTAMFGHDVTVSKLIEMIAKAAGVDAPSSIKMSEPLATIGGGIMESIASAAAVPSPAPALLPWLMAEDFDIPHEQIDGLHLVEETIEASVAWRRSLTNVTA